MFSQKALFMMTFGLLTLAVTVIYAKCNECSSISKAMCISETDFKPCADGVNPGSFSIRCPANKVCTSEIGICKPKDTASAECTACGICVDSFACISKTEFDYCDGSTRNGLVLKCPDDQYCSLDNLAKNGNICVKSCVGDPTCLEEVVPTPKPDYAFICASTTVRGNYENTYDPTCKTYVYCELLSGKMNWILITCAERSYFNVSEKKCTAIKPSYCE